MKEFRCILCHEKKYELVKRKLRGGDESRSVVKCLSCGMQQLFPLPSIEEDKKFYNINAHDKEITPQYDIQGLYDKFKYYNLSHVRYLIDFGIKKEWKMLDVACGYGFFISMMREKGYIFDGIEISDDRSQYCLQYNPEMRLYRLNLLEDSIPIDLMGKYDLLTMFHLLEHLTDPLLYLEKLRKLLKPGGLLFVELPNVSNIMMDASKEFNDFFFFRDHVAYYSPQNLVTVLEKSGFEVLSVKGNQLYGLTNHFNWIINGQPELNAPSFETIESLRWLEKMYKDVLDLQVRSEYMYAVATVR